MESCGSYSVPFFNTVFSLNKSYSKKLFVGLECNSITKVECEPVVRLIANDFHGIKFTVETWKKFTESFNEISKWFYDDTKIALLDTKIFGEGWNVRFSRSYSQKSIEIEEVLLSSAAEQEKRFKRSIVMTEVSFNHLKNYLNKCINLKLKYLQNVSNSVGKIILDILNNVFLEVTTAHEAQLLLIEKKNIIEIIESPEKIKDLIECLDATKNENDILSKIDKEIILYELFSTRMNDVVEIFNKKLCNKN